MRIWIAVHPLSWMVWPVYDKHAGCWPVDEKAIHFGPVSIHWQDGTGTRRRTVARAKDLSANQERAA